MQRTVFKQGAEAKLELFSFYGKPCIVKERFKKTYRHAVLDKTLTTHRIKSEVRALLRCRTNGIRTPTIYMVNMETNSIYMEYVKPSVTVRDFIANSQQNQRGDELLLALADRIGQIIGKAHQSNIIHGDLTTSNMLLVEKPKQDPQSSGVAETPSLAEIFQKKVEDLDIVLIDFGLAALDRTSEDKGVDLYVLERALLSTHPKTDHIFEAILVSYRKQNKNGADEVIKKLDEVRLRGRKRTMVG